MVRPPGRPCKVSRVQIITAIEKKREKLVQANNRLKSKLDDVWKSLSLDLDSKIAARTLYSIACRPDVRRIIFGDPNCSVSFRSINESKDSVDDANDTRSDMDMSFVVSLERKQFLSLIEERSYRRRDPARKREYRRVCQVMKPGLWQELITVKIWETTRLKCAFNFINHKLNSDTTAGQINGKCKCGSTLRCGIDASGEGVVRLECSVKKGVGICGKRPLRAPIRRVIGEKLCTESAAVYRAERADELMQPGDSEPPHLYKPSALHNAKYEFVNEQHLHKDPVRALEIMQLNSMANIIHNVGLNPFKVHYWTNHQLHVYRQYARKEKACLYLDATGSIIKPIVRCNGSKSSCIFLYVAVINFGGQFSVAQMISERHDTQTIMTWLTEWEKFGAPTPKEVVCDSSKALLGAAIRAFTGHATINEYADACYSASLPACFVRIDVAHFIKMYAGILKSAPPRVRVFYLAVLGQLVLCRTMADAAKILEAFLVVALSETEGSLSSGQLTECDVKKKQLQELLDPNAVVLDKENSPCSVEESLETIFESDCNTEWCMWATDIKERANKIATSEEGDRINAHYMPNLANRLVGDLRWFPLWSSICCSRFGYGRIPASSASVESEFNYIKTHLLKNCPKPMRVDVFVEKHVKNLTGRVKIAAAAKDLRDTDFSENDEKCEKIEDEENEYSRSPNDSRESGSDYSSVSSLAKKIDRTPSPQNTRQFKSTSNEIVVDLTTDSPKPKCTVDVQACDLCAIELQGCQTADNMKNLCAECISMEDKDKILSAREVENWRGLTLNDGGKKNSKYLTKNYATFDAISREKLSKIPIMQNANSTKLQAIKFGAVHYSFSNTCGFDSLIQVLLVAACDRPHVREVVNAQFVENELLHLILYIVTKGLTAHAYRLRAKMLKELFQIDENRSSSAHVYTNCEVNVAYLVSMIFSGMPSIEERSVCEKGCKPRVKGIRVPIIPKAVLTQDSFSNVVNNNVALKGPRKCCSKGCTGKEITTLSRSGPFIFFEVEDADVMQLSSIPLEFADPLDEGKSYQLIGVINLKLPMKCTRWSDEHRAEKLPMGHYTAVCRRPANVWVECNDLSQKEIRVKNSYLVYPGLLVYAKT